MQRAGTRREGSDAATNERARGGRARRLRAAAIVLRASEETALLFDSRGRPKTKHARARIHQSEPKPRDGHDCARADLWEAAPSSTRDTIVNAFDRCASRVVYVGPTIDSRSLSLTLCFSPVVYVIRPSMSSSPILHGS